MPATIEPPAIVAGIAAGGETVPASKLGVVTVTTLGNRLTTLLRVRGNANPERGNVGVVNQERGGWRIEVMDGGKRYIYRRGSKSNRDSRPGGKLSDGAISAERYGKYQHRAAVRRARRMARHPDGLDRKGTESRVIG